MQARGTASSSVTELLGTLYLMVAAVLVKMVARGPARGERTRRTGFEHLEGMLMTKSGASSLLLVLLLSACKPGMPPGAQTEGPRQTREPDETQRPDVSAGTWTGTMTYRFSESVSQTGGDVTSESSQKYEATVRIRSEQVDTGRWNLVGDADITAERSIFFLSSFDSPLGRCEERHTDEAKAVGVAVAIENGGLEISDDFYQFTVQLPDVEGSETSERKYTGCGGTNETDTHSWRGGAGGSAGRFGRAHRPQFHLRQYDGGGRATHDHVEPGSPPVGVGRRARAADPTTAWSRARAKEDCRPRDDFR